MPVQHAVLALLARGPSYGYEIKHTVETTLGPQWGQLNIGHVYQTLDRLVRDGAVSAGNPTRGTRADRIVYTITSTGRESLAQWLDTPAERSSGYRDEFFLKLAAAAWDGRAAVNGVVRRQRTHLVTLLHALSKLTRDDSPVLDTMLVEAAKLHAEADLELLDHIQEHLDEILRNAKASSAAATVPPRRFSPRRSATA
jgi:DNA-binding PadR family transcriptional regulator